LEGIKAAEATMPSFPPNFTSKTSAPAHKRSVQISGFNAPNLGSPLIGTHEDHPFSMPTYANEYPGGTRKPTLKRFQPLIATIASVRFTTSSSENSALTAA